jgi:hypothetical protein
MKTNLQGKRKMSDTGRFGEEMKNKKNKVNKEQVPEIVGFVVV